MQFNLKPIYLICDSINQCVYDNLTKEEFDWKVTTEVGNKLQDYYINVLKYPIAPLFDVRCCRDNPMFDKLYELYDEFVDEQYH